MFELFLACPVCKRISYRRALCAHCAEELSRKREPIHRIEKEYGAYSLFSWERDGFPALRWWIQDLKGKESLSYWREPALWSLEMFPGFKRQPLLVPLPSLKPRNHAMGFARAIAHFTGWEVNGDILQCAPQGLEQKRLGRQARAQSRKYILRPGAKLPSLRRPVVLVDDVITTGASVRAASRVLKVKLHVWCLMDRRPCES